MTVSPRTVRPGLPHRLVVVVAALLAGFAAVVVLAGPASAHAILLEADPADRSQHPTAPERATLTFNEPVEVPTGGIRVFDGSATRVDTGPLELPAAETVGVSLPADLPDGGYVLTYRVVSADSHVISGALTFTVGEAGEVDDDVVAELFGGARSDGPGILGPSLRGLGYIASLLAAGAAMFAWFVARRDVDRAAARRIGIPAAWAGVAVALLAVPVQGAALIGGGVFEALSPTVLGEVFASSFGQSTLVRVLALVALALAWRVGLALPMIGIAALIALASYPLDGHQQVFEPTWMLVSGDMVHLVAAALWLGGLVLLTQALRRPRVDADPVATAELVARFSMVALLSVVALTLSGVAMSIPLVGSFGALTSTGYGQLLLVKLGAVAIIVLIAAYNRQRLVPAIEKRLAPAGGASDTDVDAAAHLDRTDAAVGQLFKTVRIEAVLVVAVLLVTGFLATQQPASGSAGGMFQSTVELTEELDLDLVVDPNRAGLNTLHVYLLDQTGRPYGETEDVRLELLYIPEQIGPFEIEPYVAGPGHFIASIDHMAFPGDWEVRIVVGLDRFSETSVTVPVTVGS